FLLFVVVFNQTAECPPRLCRPRYPFTDDRSVNCISRQYQFLVGINDFCLETGKKSVKFRRFLTASFCQALFCIPSRNGYRTFDGYFRTFAVHRYPCIDRCCSLCCYFLLLEVKDNPECAMLYFHINLL